MPAAFLASALIQFVLGLVVAWLLGPAEFGYYALALAGAVLMQTFIFEWLRLAATRFHHAEAGRAFASVLLRWFAGIAAALLILALAVAVFGGERRLLYVFALLTAIATGFADLRAAMLRAEFRGSAYALFLALRNGLALLLLPMASALTGRADVALGAFFFSIVLASGVLEGRLRGQQDAVPPTTAPVPSASALARYSMPIVGTNLVYLGLFFLIRAAIAWAGGIAASGQASLALDVTLKLFTTAGTAFDLLFFQLAVRDERERGEAAGRMRVRENFERLLVLIMPMAVGLAFVVARIEPFVVAPAFRGAFSAFVLAAVPGIAAYALIQYGLHPVYQLRQDTGRLMAAALGGGLAGCAALGIALLTGAPLAFMMVGTILAAMAGAAAVLSRGLGAGFMPGGPFWLRLAAALAAMSMCLWGLSRLGDGPVVLVAMLVAGAASYALAAWIADLGRIRALLRGER